MKITLINPPFIYHDRKTIVISHCLGLRSISSYLKAQGKHEVTFIDALILGYSNVKKYATGFIVGLEIDEIIDRIPKDTEFIGLSVPFSQLAPIAHDIIDKARPRFPNATIVMGGIYPSTQPRLALTSKADYIVVGEGETAIKDLADGKDSHAIEGVYSKDALSKPAFVSAKPISDLDSIPFSDYSIPLMEEYFKSSPRRVKGMVAALLTSRGCPYDCEFCSVHPVYGWKYRRRSAQNVLEEIKYLVEKYNVNTIEFEDDNFTLDKKRTVEILEGIIRLNENGAGLGWSTPNGVRIDTLDDEVMKFIKKSNCKKLVLALEHGDDKMLKSMNKKLDLSKAYEIIGLAVKNNLPDIGIFLIVGYPGETRKRFLNSLSYLRKVQRLGGNMAFYLNIAQPYPGTRLLERCRKEGYIKDENFDNFLVRRDIMDSGHTVSITTPDFSKKDVLWRMDLLDGCLNSSSKQKAIVKKFMPLWLIGLIAHHKNQAQRSRL